jgi:hypothetical protein
VATKTFNTRIANKRDTSANWTSNNPVLLNGEVIIVDTEAGQVRYKVGNGTSTYTQLPFTDESLITNINGKLSLSGGTMTGNIDMGGHKLTGLGAPVNPNDAVRQTDLKVVSDEVDGIIAGTTGITLAPATTTKIGGVIVGDGIEVEADGTISTNPLPEGGTEGQVIKKTADGAEWDNANWLPLSGGTISGNIGIEIPNNTNFLIGQNGFVSSNGQSDLGIKLRRQLDGTYITLGKGNGGPEIRLSPNSDGGAGFIDIESQQTEIKGVVDPTNSYDAANKQYVDTQLSTKLTTPTGTQGQLLGFTADNTVGAVDAPETGLTQEQADERYLQLSGGTIEVDATVSAALTLKNTHSTGAVSAVNRSPYLNFETGNGKVVNEYIDFGSGRAEVAFYDVENDDFVAITGLLDPVYGADAANKAYVDSKAPLPPIPVTLTTSGWSSNTQTVTVSGVSATETAQLITPTPAIASQSAYYEAGIMCTGQAANSLTFTCQTVPTSNLTVYVVIQPLN